VSVIEEGSREDLQKISLTAYTLGGEQGAGSSSQPKTDEDAWTPSDGIAPPLNLDDLAAMTSRSPTRRSCIAAITLNSVGLGFSLTPIEGAEDVTEKQAEEGKARLDAAARRDRRSHRPSFTRLLSRSIWDKYEVGNGYLEVSRNRATGEIDGLYHLPGKRMRRRVDENGDLNGWVMLPKKGAYHEAITFYDFGEKVGYNDDGTPTNKVVRNGVRWGTNEVIAFQLYTSASRDYGLPPDYPLAVDYLGDSLAAWTNQAYFDHGAVPPTVLFVRGVQKENDKTGQIEVEVSQEFVAAITATLKAKGGRGRVAVVPLPTNVEVDQKDLASLSERDIGFVAYRSDNRRRTLGAFRLSPVFVADIEDAGKYTAEVERALSKEQVFDAEQEEVGDILDSALIRELCPGHEISFEEIAIEGDAAKREAAIMLAEKSAMTNGELRAAFGYSPLPEAAKDAEPDPEKGEVPYGWHGELVSSGDAAGMFETDDPDELAEFEKALSRGRRDAASVLEDDLKADFGVAIEQALATARELGANGDGTLVIEKVGEGEVLVKPYRNGGGPE
jgi:capsid portal protein